MKNRVKEERLQLQLTQAQLASRLNVSRQTIISIEISKYLPSVQLSLKLAATFGKYVEDIFILEKDDWK